MHNSIRIAPALQDCWTAVEESDTLGVTPATVRVLRVALFGDVAHSTAPLSDWTLLRLVLTASGALQLYFMENNGNVWDPCCSGDDSVLDRMRADGMEVPEG